MVLGESLVDLVADQGFCLAEFATFDCDTTKNDIVQPLVTLEMEGRSPSSSAGESAF